MRSKMPKLPWIYKIKGSYYVRRPDTQQLEPLNYTDEPIDNLDRPEARLVLCWPTEPQCYRLSTRRPYQYPSHCVYEDGSSTFGLQGISRWVVGGYLGMFEVYPDNGDDKEIWCVALTDALVATLINISHMLADFHAIADWNVFGTDFNGEYVFIKITDNIAQPPKPVHKSGISEDGMRYIEDYGTHEHSLRGPMQRWFIRTRQYSIGWATDYILFATERDGTPVVYQSRNMRYIPIEELPINWYAGYIVDAFDQYVLVETPEGTYNVYEFRHGVFTMSKPDIYYEAPPRGDRKPAQ
jgi:hypothetical protein